MGKEGRNTTGATLEQDSVIPFCGRQPADATANDDPGTMRISRRDLCRHSPGPCYSRQRHSGYRHPSSCILFSRYTSRLKPLHLCGDARRKPEASKRVIAPMPDSPLQIASHVSSAVFPKGVTAPTPVTTTLRFSKLTVSSPLRGIAIWPRVTSKKRTRLTAQRQEPTEIGPLSMAQ